MNSISGTDTTDGNFFIRSRDPSVCSPRSDGSSVYSQPAKIHVLKNAVVCDPTCGVPHSGSSFLYNLVPFMLQKYKSNTIVPGLTPTDYAEDNGPSGGGANSE